MKTKKRNKILDYVKANNHGEWLATNENGFVSKHKIHRSEKQYQRKPKHKNELIDT